MPKTETISRLNANKKNQNKQKKHLKEHSGEHEFKVK